MVTYIIIVVVITLISILMVISILLQRGQAPGMTGGIGGGLAGGGANNVGSRQTADFLSKFTAVLGVLFLSLSVMANFFISDGAQQSAIQQQGSEMPFDAAAPPAEDPDALPFDPGEEADDPQPQQSPEGGGIEVDPGGGEQ